MAAASVIGLKLKVAEASFVLDYHVCSNSIREAVRLPRFRAPGDVDVSWVVSLKPHRTKWSSEAKPAGYRGYRLFDVSVTARSPACRELMARFSVHVTQDCRDDRDATKALRREFGDLSKDSFALNTVRTLKKTKVNRPWRAGSIAFLRGNGNGKTKMTVKVKVWYRVAGNKCMDFDRGSQRRGADRAAASGQTFLADALGAVQAAGLLSDATLKVDGEALPVHRVVLAAQSEVFRAMFTTECAEKASGNVTVEDISLPVMKLLLRYLYTGAVDPEPDCLLELLVTADKYMVAGLRQICEERLLNALNDSSGPNAKADAASTLCNVLRASHLLDSEPLRRMAVGYLREHLAEVVRSAAWTGFSAQHRALAGASLVEAMAPQPEPMAEPMDQQQQQAEGADQEGDAGGATAEEEEDDSQDDVDDDDDEEEDDDVESSSASASSSSSPPSSPSTFDFSDSEEDGGDTDE